MDLEAAIVRDPEDEQGWLVYADRLQHENDPRGELIALAVRKLDGDVKRKLEEHADFFYGDAKFLLEPKPFGKKTWLTGRTYEKLAVEWTHSRFGFIDAVTVHSLDEQGLLAGALTALLSCPLGRFVRQLHFRMEDFGYEGASGSPDWGAVANAAAIAKPKSLRALSFDPGGYQLSWTASGKLGPLLAETPHLESLSVNLGQIDLGERLSLPALRTLEVETGGLMVSNLHEIGRADWPSLETMTLFLGISDYGGGAKAEDVAPILSRPEAFPKLTSLALCNAEHQGAITAAVIGSKLLGQLRTLDLSKGTMLDREAQVIVENAAAFRHLEQLDLSENYLSSEMEAAILAVLPNAEVSGQRLDEMDDEEYRYTVLGE